jgi:hypothetical protein
MEAEQALEFSQTTGTDYGHHGLLCDSEPNGSNVVGGQFQADLKVTAFFE